jgi:stearoyl-CoA desaturase (delta-9 desaturase)
VTLRLNRIKSALIQWFDADYCPEGRSKVREEPDRVDWVRCLPFVVLHVGCLGVIWVGWSPAAFIVAIVLYFLRIFAVTGFYHRYFSHKTFKTSRVGQFFLALWGATAVQRGPLWWAYHHRHHHQHSDEETDAHSPHVHGFWWAHIGWITSRRNFPTDYSKVRDLARFPELVLLNRFDTVVPALFAGALFGLGWMLETAAPQLGTSGWQMLVWGFFVSTTLLFHGTSCINSLAHVMGRRRFETKDDSRNSFLLSLITLGEGWHNNHHRFQSATRNGFYWWEFDPTYYGLKVLSWTGLIWGLKPVPASVLEEGNRMTPQTSVENPQGSSGKQADVSILKTIVPVAAAFAVTTAANSNGIIDHQDDDSLTGVTATSFGQTAS